jgi:hypothetical protein
MSRNMHDEESFYSRGQKLQPQPPKRSQLLIIGLVFAIGILIGAVGSQLLHSSQQLTTTLGITPTTTLGITPTTTLGIIPTPSPIPSPTPTQITITKNLVIPCMSTCAIALKLTTIVIDTTTQTSTWNFTLTNTSDSVRAYFSTLELEDSTGQKHQGAGLAKTDTWVMSSSQIIQTNATFDVVHGTNNLLNIVINSDSYQTETITF